MMKNNLSSIDTTIFGRSVAKADAYSKLTGGKFGLGCLSFGIRRRLIPFYTFEILGCLEISLVGKVEVLLLGLI